MSALLSLLFPSPVAQVLTGLGAGFVTYIVPVLYRKAQAALASFKAAK